MTEIFHFVEQQAQKQIGYTEIYSHTNLQSSSFSSQQKIEKHSENKCERNMT